MIETYIALIDVMVGLSDNDKETLKEMNLEDGKKVYNMRFLEQNDEQLDIAFE